MKASKVYFTDMRCPPGVSLPGKLEKLMSKAELSQIDFTRKYTAIKLHFGEPGNLAFLRPNFAKTVADRVKSLGGIPFLTDCNTLYVGRRNNALAHLDAAMENGYSPLSTGCQIIIGDGLKGTDDVEVPIPGGKLLKTAKIGRAVMDADIFLSLTHFKGHEATGFGGAIKNIGMGCGSRAGKMIMHNEGSPTVNPKRCVACRACTRNCAFDAIEIVDKKAHIDREKCVGCGHCIGICNYDAIANRNASSETALNHKMAEYAMAVLAGRPHFHISIVNQVTPFCDCYNGNDAAVVPDIGMFASFDPVALDRACIDAVNAAPALENSLLSESAHRHEDHFTSIHPSTDWRTQLAHAEQIGLGTEQYELIQL